MTKIAFLCIIAAKTDFDDFAHALPVIQFSGLKTVRIMAICGYSCSYV
jgi:hypothetical protein